MALRRLARQLLTRIRRRQFDRDLAEEMRLHLELRTRRNVEHGAAPADAVRDARRRFGGLEQIHEASRDALGWRWLDEIGRTLRASIRVARRRPIFVVSVVATLGIAIGANLAVFTVMDRVVLHPLDVPEPSGLVTAQRTYDVRGVRRQQTYMLWQDAQRLRAVASVDVALSSAAGERGTMRMVVRLSPGDEYQVEGRFVTANYFRVLGVNPALGRDFSASDDLTMAAPSVIVSHAFWRTRLRGASDVPGRTLWINDVAATIVGVAPPSFVGTELEGERPDIYLPVMTASRLATNTGSTALTTDSSGNHLVSPVSPLDRFVLVGRLRHAGLVPARAELLPLLPGNGWDLLPLTATMLPLDARDDLRQFVTLLAFAVALTFLIGCSNLASLLLGRAEERREELAVRAALGASRARLVAELLVESGVMVLAGVGVGWLEAGWILGALSAYVLPGNVAVSALHTELDGRALLVAAISTLIAIVFVAAVPAVRTTQGALFQDLKQRTSSRPAWNGLLVGTQVTACLVLVFGAALFSRSVSNALSIDVGFDPHGLVSAELTMAGRPRPDQAGEMVDRIGALDRLAETIRGLPGVSAATVGPLPLVRGGEVSRNAVGLDGVPVALPAPVDMVFASADYFTTLGQPVLRGRDFASADRAGSQPVAILNEAAARQFSPNRDAVGRELNLQRQHLLVIGVVRDVKLVTLRDSGKAIVYLPRSQNAAYLAGYMSGSGGAFLIVRMARSLQDLRASLAPTAATAGFSLQGLTSLRQKVDDILMPQRLGRLLLTLLGAIALVLTVVGVYGLVSCVVARATKEIGIRMALGARPRDVTVRLLASISWPVTLGLVAGVLIAILGGRLANRFMYGMTGVDLSTLAFAILAVVAGAAAAVIPPARAAIRIDPIVTLRQD